MPPLFAVANFNAVLRVETVACPALRTQAVVPFHDLVDTEGISAVYDDAAAVFDVWHLHAGILREYLSIVGISVSGARFSVIIPGTRREGWEGKGNDKGCKPRPKNVMLITISVFCGHVLKFLNEKSAIKRICNYV